MLEPGISDDPLGFDFMNLDVLYPDLIEIRLMLGAGNLCACRPQGKEAGF